MSISLLSVAELNGERLSSGAQCRNHLSFQIRRCVFCFFSDLSTLVGRFGTDWGLSWAQMRRLEMEMIDGWIRLWYKMSWSSLVVSILFGANSQRKCLVYFLFSSSGRGLLVDCTCRGKNKQTSAFVFLYSYKLLSVHFYLVGCCWSSPLSLLCSN